MFLGATGAADPAAAILGAPFDRGATFRRGARFAPAEIRWASQSIETASPRTGRDLEAMRFADLGDLAVEHLEAAAMVAAVRDAVARAPALPVLLGGDHLVSLGAIAALAARHPGLWVVQLDAHADLRDAYEGERLSHATVMRRVAEIVGARLIQLGVRAGTLEEFAFARERLAHSARSLDVPPEARARLAGQPVYLTIDVDVLDPAVAPGTGNPEPGGATVDEVIRALEQVRGARIVGCDLVEVSPPFDPSGRTAIAAAWLVREMLIEIGTRDSGLGTRE